MNIRHTLPGLLVALVFILGTGCEKSGSHGPSAPLTPTSLSPDTILRVHWLGKNDLGIRASAYYFMRIWELPQSGQLEAQTLARLATAPGHRLLGENGVANQTGAWLYPLLADALWNESYFEIRQANQQPAEFVLAIRLDAPHQLLWETNLAAAAESLTGAHTVPAPAGDFGWSLEKPGPPTRIALTRAGQWTLVSAGSDRTDLLDDVTARIQRDRTPYVSSASDDWLEADADLPRLAAWLPPDWQLPAGLPKISLAVTGDGGHVLTHAELSFPGPLPIQLQPWAIPTNLIHQPLMGFTAVRGVAPWLASSKMWDDLQIGPPPDQIYSWALPAGLFQTYFAAPLPDANRQVRALAAQLLARANPWLAAHGYVGFQSDQDSNGVTWGNSPAILPFVRSVAADSQGGVAYAGLIPETDPDAKARTNLFYYHPSFDQLLQDLSDGTNLVYYQWELTGDRLQSCLYIGQFLSAITRRAPLPLDCRAAVWLKTVMPRLGNCTTTITLTDTNRLSFSRTSTLGFTAAELNFLADWLESPQFPFGLYSPSTPQS
ncbi:MAG: hypothetical protein ABSF51_07080 [Verrucomicrobiota bacterium]|jgi:hypothetical protein